MEPSRSTSGRTASAIADVFWVALKLGLTSFGGPIAHLGYFERTYVRQKQWLTLEELAGLIALCQILPGPTSSQVGFLIGQRRAGLAGACAAWAGFTAPSALLMLACALWAPRLPVAPTAAILQALKWVAVMVGSGSPQTARSSGRGAGVSAPAPTFVPVALRRGQRIL